MQKYRKKAKQKKISGIFIIIYVSQALCLRNGRGLFGKSEGTVVVLAVAQSAVDEAHQFDSSA